MVAVPFLERQPKIFFLELLTSASNETRDNSLKLSSVNLDVFEVDASIAFTAEKFYDRYCV